MENSNNQHLIKAMKEVFLPQLNEFTELLKETRKIHTDYIIQLSDWQKELLHQNQKLIISWQMADKPPLMNDSAFKAFIQEQLTYCKDFEKKVKAFRVVYSDHIEDTNFMIGKLSNHWGGYIESIGVLYLLNSLRKQFAVHTFIEKFKRYWHKSRNVEIDLLAFNDTHIYIVEAKSQLKEEHLDQFQKILSKFKENVPEYSHLTIQPIIFCIHASPAVIEQELAKDWWVLRYKNFDRVNPQNSFEWLRMGESNNL